MFLKRVGRPSGEGMKQAQGKMAKVIVGDIRCLGSAHATKIALLAKLGIIGIRLEQRALNCSRSSNEIGLP